MTEPLKATLVRMDQLGIEDLRHLWRERIGEPPAIRSAEILRRCLAERLQSGALNEQPRLDPRLVRAQARHKPGRRSRIPGTSYRAGSVLVREWHGERHEVQVTSDGYVWRGVTYKSLSIIARLITGVRWNGPRFFGLREGVPA